MLMVQSINQHDITPHNADVLFENHAKSNFLHVLLCT